MQDKRNLMAVKYFGKALLPFAIIGADCISMASERTG